MMPKTSVNPAAMRKSITPYCKPLSVCSRTRATVTATGASVERKGARPGRAPRAPPRQPPLPLHRALGGVGVLVVLEDGALDLHGELAVGVLLKAVQNPDSEFAMQIQRTVFENHKDAYSAECPMKW